MNEDFLSRAMVKRNEYLLKTEELFVVNKNKWFADFAGHFLDLCSQMRDLKYKLVLSAITYLEYTMLYTNFINRRVEKCIYYTTFARYL